MSAAVGFSVVASAASEQGTDYQGSIPAVAQNGSVIGNALDIRAAIRDELAGIVTAAVRHYRDRGDKVDAACRQAARDIGITARRVKSWCYGDVWSIQAEEVQIIRGARLRLAEKRAAILRAELALEETRLRELSKQCDDFSNALRRCA